MSTRRRILIVDDEEQVLFVWRSALKRLTNRYSVEAARSGEEALRKMEHTPFDLVITDLRMPGLSGQELTRAIREQQPNLPVVWITAFRSADIDAQARQLAVICCLDKPLSVAQIRELVPQVLAGAGRKRDIAPAPA